MCFPVFSSAKGRHVKPGWPRNECRKARPGITVFCKHVFSGRPKWPPLSVKIRQHCWPSVIPRLGTLRPRRRCVDLTAQRHSTHYCAVSALNADPLWVRGRREFGELRAEANECQKLSLGRAIMSENTWWGQSSLSFAIL